jgi:5-methylcytosine-specific restriction endonuclease McrA
MVHICTKCNWRELELKKNGQPRWACYKCRKTSIGEKQKRVLKRRPYLIHKKDTCEECGFIPVHTCQLDVDHTDGNHSNNDPSNLKTLCANCHRLKTQQNLEHLNNKSDIMRKSPSRL